MVTSLTRTNEQEFVTPPLSLNCYKIKSIAPPAFITVLLCAISIHDSLITDRNN